MAYPFRPLKAKKLWKLTREREDSDFGDTDSNCSPRFESPADSCRKTRPFPDNTQQQPVLLSRS
jgi:hypothetical protein